MEKDKKSTECYMLTQYPSDKNQIDGYFFDCNAINSNKCRIELDSALFEKITLSIDCADKIKGGVEYHMLESSKNDVKLYSYIIDEYDIYHITRIQVYIDQSKRFKVYARPVRIKKSKDGLERRKLLKKEIKISCSWLSCEILNNESV